jgi:hypothetical protein
MKGSVNKVLCGKPPEVVGQVDIGDLEYCFIQYMPIYFPNREVRVPTRLEPTLPLVNKCLQHLDINQWEDKYVYLTVKYVWGSGNREGWHTDGWGTDDINFIWYDKHPTQFAVGEFLLTNDHTVSMREMEEKIDENSLVISYPSGSILMLDDRVIHRVNPEPLNEFRKFVKVSVSSHKYNLKGNAKNEEFCYTWEMRERNIERNCPIGDKK